MNNAMHQHQYSTFQHHQLHQHQQQQQRQRQRQEFQAKEEINTFLRTNEPLSPLESSHAKFKSCPMIIDAQTGMDDHNFTILSFLNFFSERKFFTKNFLFSAIFCEKIRKFLK
jgi:hypothetical protein